MAGEQISTELLRSFSPLDGLKRDNLAALARKVQVRELTPGQLLFKEGDTEKRTIYIVSGILELLDQAKVVGTVQGGSEHARNPVAPVYPRRVTGRAEFSGRRRSARVLPLENVRDFVSYLSD